MLSTYLNELKDIKSRNGSEYSYRTALKTILKGLIFTDEPTGKGKNKIDMEVYTKESLVAFYIETKDPKEDLSHKKHQDQFNRYKATYSKLLITNFIDFEFYKDGVLIGSCKLDETDSTCFSKFNNLLDNFMASTIQFNNPLALAKKLADKTKLLKADILETLNADDIEIEQKVKTKKKYKLVSYRNEFKKMLIEDIDNNQFADLYAQTLTYGLFASRYYAYQKNQTSIFTRSDASNYIPSTNPLLKQFFEVTSNGKNDLSQNINNLIDSITTILANTDMSKIISNLKLANNDIVIHFYENFLEQYDPELRKQMGVWYTPVEVVDYIVKGVDEILKTKFSIKDGISSSEKHNYTYKKKIKVGENQYKTEKVVRENVHKVQILDPATGTGNFLNSVVSYIKSNHKYPSLWNDYVNKDLIPRLNGFELMMPSYVMAHMKMYEILKDSLSEDTERFNIYLTNTLNGAVDVEDSLLVSHSDLVYQLNEEAIGANRVRQEQPVMVVLGNPPYNGTSKNQGTYITDLMSEYAMKGSNGALNDDYIKFIRYAQNLVDQNGSGVVAYISNNSFLSSVAMENMRKSLLESFDEIYVLNLYGRPIDDNIFASIKQQVAVYYLVKDGSKEAGQKYAKVFYLEKKGKRADKFKYLETGSVNKQDFKQINLLEPEYYFYPLDEDVKKEYLDDSFALDGCFKDKGTGVLTACDSLVLDTRQARLEAKIAAYFTKGELSGASDKVNDRKTKHRVTKKEDGNFTTIPYRPFDRKAYFDSDLTDTRSEKVRKHEKADNQVFLAFKSGCHDNNAFSHVLFTKKVGEYQLLAHGSGVKYAPLYIYREATPLSPASQTTNFTTDFLNEFGKAISKSHQDDTTLATDQTFSSLDAMDYIYGVLNDKAYTTKYNQFLKSNYPRVPYPDSIATFNRYKDAGSKLRVIHLDDTTEDSKSTYNATTNNKIEKVTFSNNKLYFNKSSFFDNITQDMFDFKIGASQPLKNWLESRKEDSFDESMVEQFLNVIYKVRNSI